MPAPNGGLSRGKTVLLVGEQGSQMRHSDPVDEKIRDMLRPDGVSLVLC